MSEAKKLREWARRIDHGEGAGVAREICAEATWIERRAEREGEYPCMFCLRRCVEEESVGGGMWRMRCRACEAVGPISIRAMALADWLRVWRDVEKASKPGKTQEKQRLSPEQTKLLEALKGIVAETGSAVTLDKVAEKYGGTKSTVHRKIQALERKGWLRREGVRGNRWFFL